MLGSLSAKAVLKKLSRTVDAVFASMLQNGPLLVAVADPGTAAKLAVENAVVNVTV